MIKFLFPPRPLSYARACNDFDRSATLSQFIYCTNTCPRAGSHTLMHLCYACIVAYMYMDLHTFVRRHILMHNTDTNVSALAHTSYTCGKINLCANDRTHTLSHAHAFYSTLNYSCLYFVEAFYFLLRLSYSPTQLLDYVPLAVT